MKKSTIVYLMVVSLAVALAFGTFTAHAWTPDEQALLDKAKEIASDNAGVWSLEEAAKPYRGVTLKILADAATEADAPQNYDSEFIKMTGIKVLWEQNPWDEHRSKMFMDFAAGTGIYDLVWVPFDDMASVTGKGYVQPVDKFMLNPKLLDPNINLDDYSEALWKYTSWYGKPAKPYGFPCENPTMILWYRKDLFDNPTEKANFKKTYRYELQVPKNFEQYNHIAEFFTRKKGERLAGEVLDRDFYGVGQSGKRHWASVCEWMNLASTWGGPTWGGTLDENDDVVINRPENVEALEYWISLFRFSPPGSVDWYWDLKSTAFQKNIVAMALAWNDQSYEIEDPEKSEVAGKMGYDLIPIQKYPVSHFGSWSWTIPTKAKNPDAAWLYLQWVNSRDIALKCALEGAMPSRKYVFDSPEISAIPFMPATKKALDHAFPRPVHRPEWGEMGEILALYLTKAHRMEMTAQEALDKVAVEWQRLLGTSIVHPPKT
ncbi:extracellular solute-binding protein [Candidatus Aerophobetes bacterium]|uniref:Extracellular solute-binding protein n=1 Tax=Aerophobetes bacterium TaxID=2030807 RepID=A0A523TFN7_UNCAE|nr:MAG: extracellular solute-binding protein [Candidatus Aerophobetes bacterium]